MTYDAWLAQIWRMKAASLAISAAIVTMAGLGVDIMGNSLDHFWPNAPFWVWATIFITGSLMMMAFPAWVVWAVAWAHLGPLVGLRPRYTLLGRLITHSNPHILIAQKVDAPPEFLGCYILIRNVGNEAITCSLSRARVYMDETRVISCDAKVLGMIAQTITSRYDLKKDGDPIQMSPHRSVFITDIEIHYDTIPSTGTRKSYRKLSHEVTWPNGLHNPPRIDVTVLGQSET